MTRKHFESLASNLKSCRPLPSAGVRKTAHNQALMDNWIRCCRATARTCRAFAEGFKTERFFDACGFTIEDHARCDSLVG